MKRKVLILNVNNLFGRRAVGSGKAKPRKGRRLGAYSRRHAFSMKPVAVLAPIVEIQKYHRPLSIVN